MKNFTQKFTKFAIFSFIAAMLTSCFATHTGNITNSAALSSANFKYVSNNIQGVESVKYILGIGGMSKETLVANAKRDMLYRNALSANQALSNVSVNFSTSYILFGLAVTVTCTVTADIVEFSNNGIYSYADEINDSLPPNIQKAQSNMAKTDTLESTNPSNKENPDYIIVDGKRYNVGDEIVYSYFNKQAIIEKFIRNKNAKYYYDVEIRFKKSNKVKLTSIDFIL